jgi:predicted dehydrogenase
MHHGAYVFAASRRRKMGYAYEITGTKGAISFDQEDQNAIWLYKMKVMMRRGFRKILTGPAHPDFLNRFARPGTGYQDRSSSKRAIFSCYSQRPRCMADVSRRA